MHLLRRTLESGVRCLDRFARAVRVVVACAVLSSCRHGHSAPAANDKPLSLCWQQIPQSNQRLFEVAFAGEWVTSSDVWGYAIQDGPSSIRKEDLRQLPRGRLFQVSADGTVQLASFAGFDAAVGESTERRVIRGVSVVETVFNSDGNGWQGRHDYRFDRIEAAGDRLIISGVTDGANKPVRDHLEVPRGGVVAHGVDGDLESIDVYRIEPDPNGSPPGTKRRFVYETYSPASGRAIRLDQLPSWGVCKPVL